MKQHLISWIILSHLLLNNSSFLSPVSACRSSIISPFSPKKSLPHARSFKNQDAIISLRGGSNRTFLTRRLSNTNACDSTKKKVVNFLTVAKGGQAKTSKFPIMVSELPHFLSMSFMMFLFIYVFTTVRDTKDTLVVSNCGAEAIPFLKLYGVMPIAILFILGYSKLSNIVGKQALFYCTLLPFFAFFTIFAFVLYPMRDQIHNLAIFANIGNGDGIGSKVASLMKYWSFSLYFIMSELWGAAGIPLLFWTVR